jgi:hypothetical protein
MTTFWGMCLCIVMYLVYFLVLITIYAECYDDKQRSFRDPHRASNKDCRKQSFTHPLLHGEFAAG